jgi:signal transduction histidine kinase
MPTEQVKRTALVDHMARERPETLLRRANRTLKTIRDCHRAILRARTEGELLEEVCRIIVRSGGGRMVWVGFAEKDSLKTVRLAASAGEDSDYLKRVNVTWADEPRGRGPVGTAIRTGRVSLCEDILTDRRFAPWRERAREHGYRSVLALPLKSGSQCFGALAIYAAEAGAFDTAEQRLLQDLANDLAFGFNTLWLNRERERLENEILKSTESEQERIGRDLHDGLCQLLVGAKFASAHLQNLCDGRVPLIRKEAARLEETLNHAIEQARDLARGLQPAMVISGGLAAALRNLAESVAATREIQCICQVQAAFKAPDHQAACHLYRIAQEAVQNALKHGRAKRIAIALSGSGRGIELTVKDDGVGIGRRWSKRGLGLHNMETRARLIGGQLEVRRRKQGGTLVSCRVPATPEVTS